MTGSREARLKGRVALITGATSGLGQGIARDFAAEGAQVVLANRSHHRETADKMIAELGAERALFTELDVRSEEDWAHATHAATQNFGPITILVNCAARAITGTLEGHTLDEFRDILDTNLIGPLLGMRAVVPGMRAAGGGTILNVNSTAGLGTPVGLAAYGTSKWALRGLTRIAARELARDGIIVNGFHPGMIETPMAYHPVTGEPVVDVSGFPMPRRATVEELARYVTFAVSDGASYSVGSELLADGGYLLGNVTSRSSADT